VSDKQGHIERAAGGTLFLDEIGEIPLSVQVKLLRFIQTGTFQPVGSGRTEKVDVRFVCATNRDPMSEVQAGRFREDLFARINLWTYTLPGLAQRREDIEPNIEHQLGHPRFELIRHDVCDPYKFEVDQIYNLACPASPPHYQFNPIKTTKTSFLGAMHALGLAKRTGARVFQASTSEVYGDPEIHPQPESYKGSVNPIGIRACYDEGKRVAETLFFD
jgi:hypothetical protein